MNPKEKKNSVLGKGMELINGGIEVKSTSRASGCICSPGGWAAGSVDCGCACGCLYWPDQGGSSPQDNNLANFSLADPEV